MASSVADFLSLYDNYATNWEFFSSLLGGTGIVYERAQAVNRAASVWPMESIEASRQRATGHRLLQLGITLFLLGLLTGLAIPAFGNPRMALASHMEAVMNGTFLLALGLVWPKLRLSRPLLTVGFWLAVYGTFANWLTTLLAAVWKAGNELMPLAAQGHAGSAVEEAVVKALLVSLAVAMIGASALALFGLRSPAAPGET